MTATKRKAHNFLHLEDASGEGGRASSSAGDAEEDGEFALPPPPTAFDTCSAALSQAVDQLTRPLNSSQRLAVEAATTRVLTLIQGPPGTGKTRVALTVLLAWLKVCVLPT